MASDFDTESRVWVYVSDRPLTPEEASEIDHEIKLFSIQWVSHNRKLRSMGGVVDNRFAVLMVDESQAGASGCSIDSSVRFIKMIGEKYGIDWFNRNLIAFRDDYDHLQVLPMEKFREAYNEGVVSKDTLVVDTLVNTKKGLNDHFYRPLKDSWHSRFV